MLLQIKTPYLLFLGNAPSIGHAKTAAGIAYWRRDRCLGQLRLAGCRADLGLPDYDLETAAKLGAKSLIVGVAPMGGSIDPVWLDIIQDAASMGFDIVSGLHNRLESIPQLVKLANASGANLIDLRVPPNDIKVATGKCRTGRRLLTVGTDCAVGKKYTALAIERALRDRGHNTTFRATGQTGIMIAGGGIPIDATISDFVSGAAEELSPNNDPRHWDIIEGQGSLFHPSYAAVTVGLVHGSQPDVLVLCHDLSRTHIEDLDGFPIPPLDVCINRYTEAARLTNHSAKVIGIAVNSSSLTAPEYNRKRKEFEGEYSLPCVDPVRDGVDPIVRLLEELPPTRHSHVQESRNLLGGTAETRVSESNQHSID